jgi:hypothetical protein
MEKVVESVRKDLGFSLGRAAISVLNDPTSK